MKYLLALSVLVVAGCATTEPEKPKCVVESFQKNTVTLEHVEGYTESYECVKTNPEELLLNHFEDQEF